MKNFFLIALLTIGFTATIQAQEEPLYYDTNVYINGVHGIYSGNDVAFIDVQTNTAGVYTDYNTPNEKVYLIPLIDTYSSGGNDYSSVSLTVEGYTYYFDAGENIEYGDISYYFICRY